jgi:glyoxylase-like metal-dependent hydrolase (beta-lactamase superfamily II)
MTVSRRSFFKATAFGTAALATPQIMTRAAYADAHAAPPVPAAFNRFNIGDFEVTVLSDGHNVRENIHTIFGVDQSEEAVNALLAENYLPAGNAQFTFAPTLVKAGQELILFDTGLGQGARAGGLGQTLPNLIASGYQPEDVTIVVLTHMHPDHINGLMEADGPAYPNARYVTGQVEYDFWSSEDRVGTPAERVYTAVQSLVVPLADKMTFIDAGASVVPGVTSMAAFGHTPGHMIYRLDSGGKSLVLTADTANHFVLSLQKPDWEVVFDADKAAAAQTRKNVFGMLAADRLPFIGFHMPFPSVGFVEPLGEGFRFIAETYQFDI